MSITLLKSKIHRARVTSANLNYEGSISLCPDLIKKADLKPFEKVEILNCNNGERFATYVIIGEKGDIGLNGAAARKVQIDDLVIILCYRQISENEYSSAYSPQLVFVNDSNTPI